MINFCFSLKRIAAHSTCYFSVYSCRKKSVDQKNLGLNNLDCFIFILLNIFQKLYAGIFNVLVTVLT